MTDVKTIAVVYPNLPYAQSYTTQEPFSSAGAAGFIANSALAPRDKPINPADAAVAKFSLDRELGDAIATAIKGDEYNVSRLDITHPGPKSFLASYDGLPTSADAVLDIKTLIANYEGSGLRSYAPTIVVEVKLVRLSDKTVLFDTLYQYAEGTNLYNNPNWVHPDSKYLFSKADDVDRNPILAIEGLRAGISIIANLIGEAFSKPM